MPRSKKGKGKYFPKTTTAPAKRVIDAAVDITTIGAATSIAHHALSKIRT